MPPPVPLCPGAAWPRGREPGALCRAPGRAPCRPRATIRSPEGPLDFTPFDPHAADLGVPRWTRRHRGQIELMNRVGAAIASGATPAAIAQEIGKLAGYLESTSCRS